ncbi:hypothetical protein B0H19DRAFT_1084334 [Mycena capillaripes]|nr:hypothetical protein B0H19DRAFT_1084334 [Mycena capillaripes]
MGPQDMRNQPKGSIARVTVIHYIEFLYMDLNFFRSSVKWTQDTRNQPKCSVHNVASRPLEEALAANTSGLPSEAYLLAEPPPEWLRYMLCHSAGFQYDNFLQRILFIDRYWRRLPKYNTGLIMVFAVVKRDGTTLLYKYDNDISSALYSDCLAAIAKVDLTEFEKLLDDPTRKLCMIPAYKCLSTFLIVSLTSL